MTKKPDNWMSIGEAVEQVMKARGCSRRVARQILAKKVKANKLRTNRTLIDPSPGSWLKAEEAAKRFEVDPTSVCMPLDYFMQRYDFSEDEIMGELKSGRLRASADDNTLFQVELTGYAPAACFIIDGQALLDWIDHPKTPPALLFKFRDNMKGTQH